MSTGDPKVIGQPTWTQGSAYPATEAPPDMIPTFDAELAPEDPSAPSAGLINRYREIARLHALGRTNNEICALLGYTASWMSTVLKDPFIQAEIQRIRNGIFDRDHQDALKDMARDGIRYAHSVILNPKEDTKHRLSAATWAKEQAHGKANQQITVQDNTLSAFLGIMKDMRARGEVLDVTPQHAALQEPRSGGQTGPALPEEQRSDSPQQAEWDTWLDHNL